MDTLNVISKSPKGKKRNLPPVLLVHGAWHGAWCWEGNFLDYFAKQGFETHAVDLRGHGDSPARNAMRWNRISQYTDDVLSVIEGFEQPPFVIGHSMGGFVSQHVMRRTDHLAGVGLFATVPHYGAIMPTLNIMRTRPLSFAKANLLWSLYPLVEDPMAAKHMFIADNTPDDKAIEYGRKLIDESYLGFLDMVFLNLPWGKPADVPVLVVGAEKDTLFSPASQQSTAKRYNADCKIVANAPHCAMISDQWQETADHFLNWMKANTG